MSAAVTNVASVYCLHLSNTKAMFLKINTTSWSSEVLVDWVFTFGQSQATDVSSNFYAKLG